ncbi:hypothetical protein ACI6PS_01035 [Flavobacterium sp. PLA-1-15]|uniref:hypothetical protein n=1 Tax=Flavobacterium sp. PLA-1-15 TaxID=3380533 RepID=UPI003B7827B0
MKKKTLENVKMSDLTKVLNKFKEDGRIFSCSIEQLSKHFLKEFLDINPFQVDFDELTKKYLENINFTTPKTIKNRSNKIFEDFFEKKDKELSIAVTNKEDFHKYICKKYLEIVREPKSELLETYTNTINDLKTIDDTLNDISIKRDKIIRDNKAEEIQEKLPILHYYKELNEIAKEEVIHFLKYDIRNFALDNSIEHFFTHNFFGKTPYNYNWNPQAYLPQRPNDLANKFGELPYSHFLKLKEKYDLEDKTEFNEYLANYINENEIIFLINDLLDKNHILYERKEIIQEALNIYENGKKIMFANAVPTIIEGIFHDLCLVCGGSDNELLSEGFQEKLNRLKKIFSWELHYEYYSFKFRIIRNKVAHGRLTINEINQLSDMLILDLYQVAQLVSSTKLKLNKKRFIISEFNKSKSEPNYNYVVEYILYDDIVLPEFYNLNPEILIIESIIKSQEFWDYLENEFNNGYENDKHGIFYVVKKISHRKPFDVRCTVFFKNAKFDGIYDNNKAKNYINYLIKDN